MKITKTLCVLFVVCAVLLCYSNVRAASSALKIGYFDMAAVVLDSKWGKQSKDQFEKEGDKLKAELKDKAQAFMTANEEFEKKKDVLDEKARNSKLKALQEQQQELEKLKMESYNKMGKLETDLLSPLTKKVQDIVKKIAKDQGYDYVFERDKAGMVVYNPKDDLTKKIVEELDKVSPKM